ncbi:2-oxo-4-hydroxy-4-carboxy-5-ureidoimidazoline decarboxylase [Streptomyces sp. NPDC051569]|uniref:2-oxo-4-hydroxy-4-carboxy-5-ureidoimidazoline decarboxylase n=1 Tax=Streptomyces sp. NPDC051569 TaxID=3365661 RepID=UPI0037AFCF8C
MPPAFARPVTCLPPRLSPHACRRAAFEEPTLYSAPPAGPPNGLRCFNAAPLSTAEAALLACCGSRRWSQRLADHRPYPDVDALLAAADEASYDLSFPDLAEALAAEIPLGPPHGAPSAAQIALRAAYAEYESRFGHAFVISLDRHHPDEYLGEVLARIRARLTHEPDHERALAADELRRLARSRLAHLIVQGPGSGDPDHPHPPNQRRSRISDSPDSPSVAV